MLTRAQKEEQIADLRDRFGRATSVFVADYRGLSVDKANVLRAKLRGGPDGDFDYRVTKNSVLRRAVADTSADVLLDCFNGPTAIAISYGDPVALAKILVDYSKENEVFELKGALLDGRSLDSAEIATLATLPSLDGVRSQLIGLLQAPAGKLARLLKEPGAQVTRLIDARRRELESAG